MKFRDLNVGDKFTLTHESYKSSEVYVKTSERKYETVQHRLLFHRDPKTRMVLESMEPVKLEAALNMAVTKRG
jgi:hypothetical protein